MSKSSSPQAAGRQSGSLSPTAIKPKAEILAEQRVAGLAINPESMALLSNLHRASGLLRSHFENKVLASAGLHWSAFVTLWCLWIYGELPSNRLAFEVGVAKSSLTSIMNQLESRHLISRRTPPEERRMILVKLTEAGDQMLTTLFPQFNAEESRISSGLSPKLTAAATRALREIILVLEEFEGDASCGR
ncbi:MAG: MarR family winged helix-turn-helix transcriptional regulator [Candidatus Symbiobacter sp.]|nr:MarR family winged helix-turn-helix transcriptional regulator [Candidatus Symbiobacter sp.]